MAWTVTAAQRQPIRKALCAQRNHVSNKVEIKSIEELESMHTGSLMSRRNALLKCEESYELSDQFGISSHDKDAGVIEFKDSNNWKKAYKELRSILATREHIPNKEERKALRQAKAKSRK